MLLFHTTGVTESENIIKYLAPMCVEISVEMKRRENNPAETPVKYGSLCFWGPRSVPCKMHGIRSVESLDHLFLMGD